MAKKVNLPPELFAYYATHPVEWVEDVWLGLTEEEQKAQRIGRRLEWEQKIILNAIAGHKATVVDKKNSIVTVEYNHPSLKRGRRVAVRSGHGIGKAQPIDEPVLCPGGWRNIGDLCPGDMVITPFGPPAIIINTFPQGVIPTYKVTCSDGATTFAAADHLWLVRNHHQRARKQDWCIRTTQQIAESISQQWEIPLVVPEDAFVRVKQSRLQRRIVSIKRVDDRECVCIMIDSPQQLYITRDYIVTHNSFIESAAMAWFMHTRPHPTILLTGPKYDQLKSTIWAQLNRSLMKSFLVNDYECTSEKFYRRGFEKTWFAEIVTARDAERIQGYHNDHLMVVIDEGSGEAVDAVAPSLLSCATQEDNIILTCGNPTRTIGFFRDCFGNMSQLWVTLHFDSRESCIVDPSWLEDAMIRYHPDGDMFRVRVKGEFPQGNPKSIINLSDCEAARSREVVPGDFVELGVDPALEGNDLATIAIRQGMKLHEIRSYPKTTPSELYHFTIKAVRDYRAKTKLTNKVRIKVDAHGGYGSALIESLGLNTDDNVEVLPVYSNARSTNPEYANYGTEMWYNFNAMLSQIELPQDPWLIEELSSREWVSTDLTKIAMEPKTNLKERLGRSPDRADACVLCFADGPRRVFSRGDDTPTASSEFVLDWEPQRRAVVDPNRVPMTHCLHMVGVVMTDDLQLYGLAMVYKYYEDMLYVYGEYHESSPIVDRFAPRLSMETMADFYMDQRRPRFIGNAEMFKSSGDKRPMADIFRREGRMNILEPVRYDEFGAIALGAQMFANGKIRFHKKCSGSRIQTETWVIAAGKSSAVENGYCKALLLVLSEIKRRKPETMAAQPFHDYQRVIETKTPTTNVNRWAAR